MNYNNNDLNLKSTSTDMLVNFVANSEKLIPTEERFQYGDALDDNVDNYVGGGTSNNSHVNNIEPIQNPSVFQKQQCYEGVPKNDIYTKNQECKEHNTVDSSYNNNDNGAMLREELLLQKLDTLRRLGELKQCGVHISRNYGMDDDLDMMKYELKLHNDIRSKQNAVQWMSHMMIGCLKGVEMLNDNYNPFDIKLVGLTDKISSDIQSYYMVLGEIYEKYNQPGKQMAPEMKLILMLSGAVLSLQASRIIPAMIPNLGSSLKTDESLISELRGKAENKVSSKKTNQQSNNTVNNPTNNSTNNSTNNQTNGQINNPINEEHKAVSKKMEDIQLIREKELEVQKLTQMMDKKNNKNRNFKEALLLSTEQPPTKNSKKIDDHRTELSKEEMDNIRNMRYMEEQRHLDLMRNMAHQRSNINTSSVSTVEQKKFLEQQNNKLDMIISKLSDNDKNENDSTDSHESKKSIISVNPKLDDIMKSSPIQKSQKSQKSQTYTKTNKSKSNDKESISFGSSKTSVSGSKKQYDIDIGTISFGSKNKGEIPFIVTNK